MQALQQRSARARAFGTARPLRKVHLCKASSPAVVTAQSARAAAATLPSLPALDGSYETNVAFTEFANWLIPGTLMVGRYPYVEPSRCTRRELGEQQLERILETGVTTFVSLQAEVPAQEEMKLSGKSGFLPYKATADLIRASLNGPPPMAIVEGLRNPMLDKYLPARKRPEQQPYHPIELEFCHCPIEDLGLPEKGPLATLIADLEQRILAGEKLYVHCWGGRGRAGTVGACLLAHMYGLSAEEVLERVQRSFDTRQDGGRRSPETDEQLEFVRAYVAGLGR
ncbi:hypothetical protein HYH03_016498 [Edaphochlamys debaryana]|uniref:Tyrosine specific protein phosphatases domain-containing protein n=1 Tax=Edaphochlamys debaryana TaxID=47281 RepID=A0A836BPW6_9CHLO|nr:hypothetical protein HYH03_016498 [Edaphochlamys debaryana]|eukprot:KAG2484751.1 hypothetical protein HYH03_016498 [Edaphochlamys debaryana]